MKIKILLKMLKCDLLCARNTTESINEAIEIYSSIIKENPALFGCYVGLARCYTRTNDFEKATNLLKHILI